MKTIDKTVLKLCDEVDYWKEQAQYWEAEAEKYRQKWNDSIDSSIKYSKTMIGHVVNAICQEEVIKQPEYDHHQWGR